jgi:hypothetical protein
MIEVLVDDENTVQKVINPVSLEFEAKLYGVRASWTQAGEVIERTVRSVSEVMTFPAPGDQRIWIVSNFADAGAAPDLYLNQSRVIGFQVRRELEADWYSLLPISVGITDIVQLTANQCVFLADLTLRTICQLSIYDDRRIALHSEQTSTDILRAIQHGLKLPELTIEQLPIELIGIFADEVGEKRNGTR